MKPKEIQIERRGFSWLGRLALVAMVVAAHPAGVHARDAESHPQSVPNFQPNETMVSSQFDLIDPEYDQETARIVWADSDGCLWLASLDRDGMYQPPSGKGLLLDPEAMNLIDLRVTGNGPEWIQTDEGPKVVYTKFLNGLPHIPKYGRLALAQPMTNGGGGWGFELLSPLKARMAPYASSDKGDPVPRITYADEDRNHYWAELYDPSSEVLIPLIEPSALGVRFVPNSSVLVFTAPSPIDSILQVFTYDVETQVAEQLTFDDFGDKSPSSVWMWQAPEFNNESVFLVLVYTSNASYLDIYREVPAGGGQWTKINSIVAPFSKLGSPEPFTFEGRSYVTMQLTFGVTEYPTSIWLAGIDPENPLFRKISDDSLVRWRTDPEVYITHRGPYAYYNRRDPADPGQCAASCTEGVYRAYTGLVRTGVREDPEPTPHSEPHDE